MNEVKTLLAIACGGALGALSRYGVSKLCLKLLGLGFPMGTLIVNFSGSFLIGLLTFLFVGKQFFTPTWQGFIVIGYLGAFTTFSTFSLQTLELALENLWLFATLNILLNVCLSIIGVFGGMFLARVLIEM